MAATATGTALMIVAQLTTVFSMTVLSVWGSASQQRHRWLGEVSPSLTSLVSSRSFGLVQRLHHRRRPTAPALGSRASSASHSGNDAYGPQVDHALREQPALRQEQTSGGSVGSRYQLPCRGWATTLVAIAQLITFTPVMTRFSLSYRCLP